MTALVIASASVRRLVRDRVAMFFAVLLPLVVILIVGSAVGGFDTFRVAVVEAGSGPLERRLVTGLERSPALEVTEFADAESAQPALRRGQVSAVVVIPAGYDARLRDGRPVVVPVQVDTVDNYGRGALTAVSAVVAEQGTRLQAAAFVTANVGGTLPERLSAVDRLSASVGSVPVRVDVVDGDSSFLPQGFSSSAPTMLVLFIFINALAGGAALVQTRKLGIHSRVLAAPVRTRDIVLGESLTYVALAVMQSVLIVGGGALLFGVDWGDPRAAIALVGAWVLVGTGAGMLSGALFRTPEQASSIGPALGIGLGMLGGTMWPLEIVGPTMQTIGHVAPHAWAVDAWTVLISQGGSIVDIALELTVLLGFAAAMLVLAVIGLNRRLTA